MIICHHVSASYRLSQLDPIVNFLFFHFFYNLLTVPSAITVTQNETKLPVKKERCKFYPACTRGERCEYIHPSTPCKAFPNCKFGDKCLYIHPKCKFDLTCSRLNCNFSHTPVASAAPPLGESMIVFFYCK